MRLHLSAIHALFAAAFVGLSALGAASGAEPIDPGVRHAVADNGPPLPLPGLTALELAFFQDGLARFSSVKVVVSPTGDNSGLGPRYNSNQCSSCHLQPFVGGSSPAQNPLLAVASSDGAANRVPWFITANGPIREARFVASADGVPDGGVHDLFVITGRSDAGSCNIAQPDFAPAGNGLTGQGGNRNIVFRIPTPLLGAGLIEAIPDAAILANARANSAEKRRLGVSGHPNAHQGGNVNRSANDGTITRFGWKAQNKSLLLFSGEAYNVEMGVSNLLFPQERDETTACQGGNLTPNDTSTFASAAPTGVLSDMEAFADFMRTLAAPVPAPPSASSQHGSALFASVGCALCHTPALITGAAVANGDENTPSAALSNQQARLFSDLLLHHMGTRLADGITQGAAGPDEFRTAPLWGVGQRVFFLHDGRTGNLIQAINMHASEGSEANQVVQNFSELSAQDQQDLINFLRSL
ncbi:MAG TPA: di-heme oxidoredictase family protein [Steroidobacteraceae bacterium]|nr:di-heme oxidoredictase family protein [Steroidobacteraceae bacterium]